ncbi:unnamed protein product [Ceratitis capitata]|uniref:(Mediterranean fruit fly) hypothetical protein n=1 Tax=Ceratitis capitata TaxID=7213 RepID=A0A811U3G8_CERCA|nr:unnamed protein product [Ceratitis capitata]
MEEKCEHFYEAEYENALTRITNNGTAMLTLTDSAHGAFCRAATQFSRSYGQATAVPSHNSLNQPLFQQHTH